LAPLQVIPGHGAVFADVEKSLAVARRRLDGLRRNPEKHARHAIKVLMKFKLLEMQSVGIEEWDSWLRGTPYLANIRARFFAGVELDRLTADILGELMAVGAASMDDAFIRNA
jgi:hypothetical protein